MDDRASKHEAPRRGPTVIRPGHGERIGTGAAAASILATSDSTDGRFTITETTIPPGFPGPPPHTHREMTDAFYVVEGTLTVHLDGEAVELEAGSYASVPPGHVHSFSNQGHAPTRFLNINSPGGWERYLRAVADLMKDGAPDPAGWKDLMEHHDITPRS